MIYVRGSASVIAQNLARLHAISAVPRGYQMPDEGEMYLFCSGLLRQKRAQEQTENEKEEGWEVNFRGIRRECDRLIGINPKARICIVGSEAAYTGSYDMIYAMAKTALHGYVENKRLEYPDQQLVCVAPSIIKGTRMTDSRNEDGKRAMEDRRLKHPKQRWLEPMEVAKLIHWLLCVDSGYITNTVIRMNGGEHCR